MSNKSKEISSVYQEDLTTSDVPVTLSVPYSSHHGPPIPKPRLSQKVFLNNEYIYT